MRCKRCIPVAVDPTPSSVTGGTDVTRLKARFEWKFGLAQVRAEEGKMHIVHRCGVMESHVLAMVFGPQHTSDLAGRRPPRDGNPDDRRVQVWAIWRGRKRFSSPNKWEVNYLLRPSKIPLKNSGTT